MVAQTSHQDEGRKDPWMSSLAASGMSQFVICITRYRVGCEVGTFALVCGMARKANLGLGNEMSPL